MANIDSNLIATAGFVISSENSTKTISLNLQGVDDGTNITGWIPIEFNTYYLFAASQGQSGLKDVTPSVNEQPFLDFLSAGTPELKRVLNFLEFMAKNAVHVKEINLRASNSNMLPSQIVVDTPNIFNNQMDRQLIDVASQITAYQYQNDIITIKNVDLLIGREASLLFNGSFSVANTNTLYVDLVIDYYISLEKGLKTFLDKNIVELI